MTLLVVIFAKIESISSQLALNLKYFFFSNPHKQHSCCIISEDIETPYNGRINILLNFCARAFICSDFAKCQIIKHCCSRFVGPIVRAVAQTQLIYGEYARKKNEDETNNRDNI